jgi:hypothetical protein
MEESKGQGVAVGGAEDQNRNQVQDQDQDPNKNGLSGCVWDKVATVNKADFIYACVNLILNFLYVPTIGQGRWCLTQRLWVEERVKSAAMVLRW